MTTHHRGTTDMVYLDTPIPFQHEGHPAIALVADKRRVFARWVDGPTVHLAWVKNWTIPRQVGAR